MNHKKKTVRILLATYQGATYLPALLDSLLKQDYSDLEIVASDDGSSDESASILAAYAERHSDRIIHHCSGRKFGNAQDHFLYLLRHFGDAPYLMFCDQDDIWHSDKVSATLAVLHSGCPDPSIPALVHTDLCVVDQNLQELSPSFLRFSSLDGNHVQLHQLLVQNVVTGCTVMLNHALAELFCHAEYPDHILMHDWYLALLAAACGKVLFLDRATIDYRQHGSNAVGAKNARSLSYLLSRLKNNDAKYAFVRTTSQAASLLSHYNAVLPEDAKQLLEIFAHLPEQQKTKRLACYQKYRLYKQSLPRRIGQILWW